MALGNGDGTFNAPITFETNHIITSFSLADFDGNGRLDLALVLHGRYLPLFRRRRGRV